MAATPAAPRYRRRRSRSGMTLIEVVIAIAILAVMTLFIAQTLASSVQTRELLQQNDETTRAARVALSKLRRELQVAFLSRYPMAVNQYSTVFVGQDEDPDTLIFTTLAHQRLYRDSRESDQTEVTVWAERSPDEDRSQGYILYHREAPRIDSEPDEGGIVYPLAYNVQSFNVRYLDPITNEWRDEWDTRSVDTPNRLPRAAQLALVLLAPDPDDPDRTIEVPFLTTVTLQFGSRLTPQLF